MKDKEVKITITLPGQESFVAVLTQESFVDDPEGNGGVIKYKDKEGVEHQIVKIEENV